MSVQVGPSKAGDITPWVRAIITKEEDGVFEDFGPLVFDSQVIVYTRELGSGEILVSSHRIVSEYDVVNVCLAVNVRVLGGLPLIL